MKNKNVIISIIVPYFRKKKYFQKTINSVLNQTFKKYEIIIIYDDKDKSDLGFIKRITKNNDCHNFIETLEWYKDNLWMIKKKKYPIK